MATIVKNKKTGEKFILLGSGFGAYQYQSPNLFFGDMFADTEEGQFAMICVCNARGTVGWFESSEVVVESVDGESVDSILPKSKIPRFINKD